MQQQAPQKTLIFGSIPYPVPDRLDILNSIDQRIFMSLYNFHRYEVQSDVNSDIFDSFYHFLFDGQDPNIEVHNIEEYHLLNQEFHYAPLDQLIQRRRQDLDEYAVNLYNLDNPSIHDHSHVQGLIAADLDNYVTQHGEALFSKPIESLHPIFGHPNKHFTQHNRAYELIRSLGETRMPNLFTLLPFLDFNDLTEGNQRDSIEKQTSHLNFLPKVDVLSLMRQIDRLKSINSVLLRSHECNSNRFFIENKSNVIRDCENENVELLKYHLQPLIKAGDNLVYKLDVFNMTATLYMARDARGEIVVPRSIQHSSCEYVIKTIGRDAFSYNGNVTSLSFSDDTQIQTFESNSIFYSSFRKIVIPATVEKLCPGWIIGVNPNVLDISLNNPNFSLVNGNLLIGKSDVSCENFDLLVIAYNSSNVVIPSTIKRVVSSSFDYCDLQTISFQENSLLEVIEHDVFAGKNIQRIRIPSSLKEINKGAFEGSNLSVVEFENDSQLTLIGKKAFSRCQIESIAIPDSVKTIEDHAFFSCRNLSAVSFGDNSQLEKIGSHAFDSTVIESFELPRSVKYIGEIAFFECQRLNRFIMPQNSELQVIDNAAFGRTPLDSVHTVDDLRRLQVNNNNNNNA